MSEAGPVSLGARVSDATGRRIGRVDAVFVDYLLVRTVGLLPVDLYVPVTEVSPDEEGTGLLVSAENAESAYSLWHRPLKRAPHD